MHIIKCPLTLVQVAQIGFKYPFEVQNRRTSGPTKWWLVVRKNLEIHFVGVFSEINFYFDIQIWEIIAPNNYFCECRVSKWFVY